MDKYVGVLLDTVSIQKYIYSSYSLKENIGASYFVNAIFNEKLKEAVEIVIEKEFDLNSWKEKPGEILLKNEEDSSVEVGYAGGGNALLLFKKDKDATSFVREWTTKLLIETPGLKTAVAIGEIDLSNFKCSLATLYKKLTKNKNKFQPTVSIMKYSITAEDPKDQSAAITYNDSEKNYISAHRNAVLDGEKLAAKDIVFRYRDILNNKYDFTNKTSELGQIKGKNHIAVVHVDGNKIGEKFQACESLVERRRLSRDMTQIMEESFGLLIKNVIDHVLPQLKEENEFKLQKTKDGKLVLPIRPIIIGGDDITFISEGRLGLFLAEKLMHIIQEKSKDYPYFKDEPLHSCAGVSITGTSFPFYKSYEMAEDVCGLAKDESREEGGSWIDFHITHSGFTGKVEEVRKRHYKLDEGFKLNFGPYSLNNETDIKSISHLKKGINHFKEKEWPISKIKELRSSLASGRFSTTRFIDEHKSKGLTLPKIKNYENYSEIGWIDDKTPYFDMIEIMKFYPSILLKGDENESG